MDLIFWGVLFTNFYLTFNYNGVGFDITPDFIGFALIFLGLAKYKDNQDFKVGQIFAVILFVLSLGLTGIGVLSAIGFINVSGILGLFTIISYAMQLFSFIMLFMFVRGADPVANQFEGEKEYGNLKKSFLYYVIALVIVIAIRMIFIPFAIVGGIFEGITLVVFLVRLYRLEAKERKFKLDELYNRSQNYENEN